jgi:hypothetical protein
MLNWLSFRLCTHQMYDFEERSPSNWRGFGMLERENRGLP